MTKRSWAAPSFRTQTAASHGVPQHRLGVTASMTAHVTSWRMTTSQCQEVWMCHKMQSRVVQRFLGKTSSNHQHLPQRICPIIPCQCVSLGESCEQVMWSVLSKSAIAKLTKQAIKNDVIEIKLHNHLYLSYLILLIHSANPGQRSGSGLKKYWHLFFLDPWV